MKSVGTNAEPAHDFVRLTRMNSLSRSSITRFALTVFVAAALMSCASDEPDDDVAQLPVEQTATPVATQPDDDSGHLRIVVGDESDIPDWRPPPWEQFVVELAPVTIREQTTAVGEGGADGATPLGASCEQLLADFPELTGCQEYTDEFPEEGIFVDIGRLDPDGTMTIESPPVASALRIEAIDPTDELCSWFGYLQLEPNQPTATVEISLACA